MALGTIMVCIANAQSSHSFQISESYSLNTLYKRPDAEIASPKPTVFNGRLHTNTGLMYNLILSLGTTDIGLSESNWTVFGDNKETLNSLGIRITALSLLAISVSHACEKAVHDPLLTLASFELQCCGKTTRIWTYKQWKCTRVNLDFSDKRPCLPYSWSIQLAMSL
jgi:hypothetical protein